MFAIANEVKQSGRLKTWIAALLFVPFTMTAGAVEYELDRSMSYIRFQPSARFGSGKGEFRIFDVKTDVDEEKIEKSKFEVTIQVASIDTGIKKRDKHLRTADFFDVENHPTAILKVTEIRCERDPASECEAAGELTIRGVTKEADLPVKVKEFKDGKLEVEGETEIKRKDFNINYDSAMNPIKNTVKVIYRLALRRKAT